MANITNNQIIEDIRNLLIFSRQHLQQSINSAMVQTYWQIGKMIVEDEQKGKVERSMAKSNLNTSHSIFLTVIILIELTVKVKLNSVTSLPKLL